MLRKLIVKTALPEDGTEEGRNASDYKHGNLVH